ncbi:MAG: redoxin domain-containing protein [Thermomicrobiales bacterium]
MEALLLAARLILAAVFVVSGVAKLLDLSGGQKAMRSFGVPESMTSSAGILLPIVELLVAVLLIPTATAKWGALAAFLLLAVFTIGISYNLARGRKFECHCFGELTHSEIGPSTLIRNAVLAVIALFVAYNGFANDTIGLSVAEGFGGLDVFQWLVLIIGVVILLALAGIAWLLVHLLGQNGRLLVRIDAIESALEDADIALPSDDDEDEEDEEEEEEGLPFGSPAPAFSLSGLYGETMTLDALRAAEKPVMLIFSDPGCGPCNGLMPEVGKWQQEHADKLTIAVISRGSLEDNRSKKKQHNLGTVLMQKDSEVADEYLTYGTPTAVLVRPDGTIGSGAAGGADEIRTLLKQALAGKVPVPAPRAAAAPRPAAVPAPARPAAPAPQPQAARGLASIGRDAPVVELNDLEGKPVKLADFAGHPTAVLFWNPGCGFCQRMVDDLKAWESNHPADAPKLLVVSTGEVDRNKELGLGSPVVLDGGFNTGRAFGASGTPSAVLVSADGKIASGLAVGGPTVLSLLRNEAPHLLDPSAAEPEAEAPAAPRGVGRGGKAPQVELPDLDGKRVALDDIRNGRTALLFWNPGCGFCQRLVSDLKEWETSRGDTAPQLVLISTGAADANRAHGLSSTILLDQGFSTGEKFGASGTPSAILIDADGNVASDLAVGGPDVMSLLRS